MQSYQEMTKEELLAEKKSLEAEYKKFQQRGLKLDMSRGKPSQEQLFYLNISKDFPIQNFKL